MTLDEIKSQALVRIVDDDAELAEALRFFLEIEGWKAVVYTRAKEFFAADMPSRPGCVLLDVRMPELTGLECQRLLKEHQVSLPVIFMSGHGDIDMAVQTILDGALDFMQKPVDEERLLRVITKGCTQSVEASLGVVGSSDAKALVETLTARELEIAKLVAENLVSRTIGERLGIATRTVEVHRASALKKLGVRTPEEIKRLLQAAKEG